MIHFFTDPYKDELIYSAIARYHYYTGNLDFKDTLEELFGSRSRIPSFEIGSGFRALAENLGGRYSAEKIIKNHTIFPFYSPFLPEKRKIELMEDIKCKDGKGLYAKLGITAGSICKKKSIYYCPCCAKLDIEKYGEAYIHREHQLQGVYICPHDGAGLKKYPVNKSNSSRIEFIRLDMRLLDLRSMPLTDDRYHDRLYKLSKDAYYLLQADLDNISEEKVLKKYENRLSAKGLTASGRRIKQKELYEEFINFYGTDFLKTMESGLDNDYEYNWLRVITRKSKRTVHPIRHLLFINFLENDINKFFKETDEDFEPFGKGPWPCLNYAAEHYRQDVITDLKVTEDYKAKVPVGTFACNKCGFVYSRRGPDRKEQDRYKIGRIKNFGKVWENKLKCCLEERKYGLREVARLMNCDPKIILKFDRLFNIYCFSRRADKKAIKADIINGETENLYKDKVIKTIRLNPGLSRTEVRKLCKKEYAYLYRRNKEWLLNVLPEKSKKINPARIVDWDKRDNEILKLLEAKYEEISSQETPVRITKSLLGKSISLLAALEKNIKKLPETEKYLNEIIETVQEFQIRRCKKIIDNISENEADIKLWKLQRTAGIRTGAFEKIKNEIQDYINMKNSKWIHE